MLDDHVALSGACSEILPLSSHAANAHVRHKPADRHVRHMSAVKASLLYVLSGIASSVMPCQLTTLLHHGAS